MAITKNPAKQTKPGIDKAAKDFIDKAGKAAPGSDDKTPVLFRFREDFLARIDAAARKQELPRQAWVRTIIAEALEARGL
jgi:hypothetical protein